MRLVEFGDALRIDDHLPVDDEIRHQRVDNDAVIDHIERALLLDDMPALPQLDHQCIFICLFFQARAEDIEHGHRSADNVIAQFPVDEFIHAHQCNRWRQSFASGKVARLVPQRMFKRGRISIECTGRNPQLLADLAPFSDGRIHVAQD